MNIPASHSCPNESKKRFISGNKCTVLAAGGRFLCGRSPMCVEHIVEPSGRVTVIFSFPAGCTFVKKLSAKSEVMDA